MVKSTRGWTIIKMSAMETGNTDVIKATRDLRGIKPRKTDLCWTAVIHLSWIEKHKCAKTTCVYKTNYN